MNLERKTELKRIEKEIDADIRKLLATPKKTMFTLVVLSIVVSFISCINGIDEGWARVISPTLITVDGLLLGFVVLGATNISNKEFMKAVNESLIRKYMNDFFDRIQEKKRTNEQVEKDKEFIQKEFYLTFQKTGFSMGVMQGSFEVAVWFLFVSIGASICLFGVHGSYTAFTLPWFIFWVIDYFAIGMLLNCGYILVRGFFTLLTKGAIAYAGTPKEFIESIFE